MDIGKLYDELYLLENDSVKDRQYVCHQLINGEQKINETLLNILKQFGMTDNKKILDAGSGYGGSILYLVHKMKDCQFVGYTLSRNQFNISKMLLQDFMNCSVYLQNYNQLNTAFDVIYAIESINHSDNLYNTLSNWNLGLNNNGIVIIIDDFLTKIEKANDIESFRKNWSFGNIYTLYQFIEIAYNSGFVLADSLCLSAKFQNHFKSKSNIKNPNHEAYIGSNIRNRLYKDSILGYNALVFVKKSDYKLHEQQIIDAFDSIYSQKGLKYLRNSFAYDVFCNVLKPKNSSKILDVACGPGLLSQALNRYCFNLENYTGIDLSPKAIELTRQKKSTAGFFCKSIHDMPFYWNNYFDYVVVLGVFERLYYRNACFLHIRRILKDNGKCLIMVRNSESKWWQEQYQKWEPENSKEGAYSVNEFKTMIEANLFEVEKIYPDLHFFPEKTDFEKVKSDSKEIIFIIRKSSVSNITQKSNTSKYFVRDFIKKILYGIPRILRKVVYTFFR